MMSLKEVSTVQGFEGKFTVEICFWKIRISFQIYRHLTPFFFNFSSFQQENQYTILVLSESSEEFALDVVDTALSILSEQFKIDKFIIWRNSTDPKRNTSQKTLKCSKLKVRIVLTLTLDLPKKLVPPCVSTIIAEYPFEGGECTNFSFSYLYLPLATVSGNLIHSVPEK